MVIGIHTPSLDLAHNVVIGGGVDDIVVGVVVGGGVCLGDTPAGGRPSGCPTTAQGGSTPGPSITPSSRCQVPVVRLRSQSSGGCSGEDSATCTTGAWGTLLVLGDMWVAHVGGGIHRTRGSGVGGAVVSWCCGVWWV